MNTSIPEAIPQSDAACRIETAVTMESDSHFFLGSSDEVAIGGVFIATGRDLAIGQRLRVELALHNYVLVFRGTVRWRADNGVGVTFDAMSGPARGVIESFCARRRAPKTYDLDALTRAAA
jgi:hypothetical protein